MSNTVATRTETASEVCEVSQNVIIRLEGNTSTERKLSAVRQAGAAASLALSDEKGKVGAAARTGSAQAGFAKLRWRPHTTTSTVSARTSLPSPARI